MKIKKVKDIETYRDNLVNFLDRFKNKLIIIQKIFFNRRFY